MGQGKGSQALVDSFFVDRHGIIRVIHLGEMSPEYIEQQVLELL